MQIVNLIIFRK